MTLMTYDPDTWMMVVVEVVDPQSENLEAYWNLSLPFGMGLAGACYRLEKEEKKKPAVSRSR